MSLLPGAMNLFLFFDVDAVSDLLKYDGSELILGNFVVDVTAYSRP